MKTADAAHYLRASGPSTVRAWIARGLLLPDGRVGIGGSWLFKRSTLDRFAETCAGGARRSTEPAARTDAPGRGLEEGAATAEQGDDLDDASEPEGA